MEKSETRLNFLDKMINKSGTKIWARQTNVDSKRYVSFTTNHPRQHLTYIPFFFARKICTIVENKNIKEKRCKELKKTYC